MCSRLSLAALMAFSACDDILLATDATDFLSWDTFNNNKTEQFRPVQLSMY